MLQIYLCVFEFFSFIYLRINDLLFVCVQMLLSCLGPGRLTI